MYFKTKAIVKIFKNAFQTLQLYNKYLNSNKLQQHNKYNEKKKKTTAVSLKN